jgi:TP901 family phage tail tape measure protein
MAETTREMVVRLSMDAGGFKKTANEINRQIRNIDKEIRGMGGDPSRSQLEEKLGLQQKAVDNLQKAVEQARQKFVDADTDAKKLLAAKQLSGLETELANAEQKALALKNQLSAANLIKFGTLATNFGRSMRRMGQKFTMYIGAPLAALGISSFNAFKDYELALARLKAVLPEAGEEIERLNQAALEMSETIPVSYEEIMAIMTSLAKAGVPVGEIEGMTLALSRMSAVTGMTAEEVGTSMVMFMNSMGLPMGNVDQLGAALVQLADTSIATEGAIFDMATRMAATGGLAGMSATEVLSLSAAFASMGLNAEAGGTSASKLMKRMQLAAETGKGIEGFADVMGISTEDFTKMWDSSAADTMLAFFQGLADVEASGEASVLAMLDAMELTEIRLSNLIELGAKKPDMFESLMGTGAKGFEDNTALVKKAGDIFNTTSGQMDMLGNSVRNAQADLGENVADTFQPLIDKVGELVKGFGELDEGTQNWIVGVGGGLAVGGPVLMGLGKVVSAVGSITTAIGKAKTSTGILQSAISNLVGGRY